jgi:hypothetical protein
MPSLRAAPILACLAFLACGPDTPDRRDCTPTTCAAEGKNCGSIPDGCGATLQCGNCSGTQSCGGDGVANVCGASSSTCTAESDAAFCRRLDKNCGRFSGTDICGQTRTAECGDCTGGTCTANVCRYPAGSRQPGQACLGDEDCVGGELAYCEIEWPGGYCMIVGCEDDAGCPTNSICVGIDTNEGVIGVCVAGPCVTDNDCRASEGYICDVDESCWYYED